MTNLDEKIIDTSVLIEKQLPSFVRESNPKFISFLSSYYESQEVKYSPLDVVENLIEYYNIGHYTPSTLKEYTNISSSVSASATTINVISTDGFPDSNGYIQIEDEIIFYRTKTKTQFLNCVRSTAAFTLEKIPTTNVVYTTGGPASSYAANVVVYNISYQFANEFFSRIKTEISPTLPEVLAPDLNITSFLKNISSFYRSKGTENSHKLLFRILFNERRVKLKLNPSGLGANINILNYAGDITSFQVVSSGSGYYYELVNNQLVSPPIITIIGSGTGAVNPDTLTTSKTAEMVVTKMTPAGGIAIDGVQVVNKGFGYVGPITARVRERSFDQDQVVNCIDSNNNIIGSGKVYSWSDSSRELILYQISGYFTSNSRVVGLGGEQPRARISAAYPTTETNKQGNPSIEIIPIDPIIERPKENVIKASAATFYERKILRCELISGASNLDGVKILELVQSRDLSYKIPGVTLEISEIQKLENNLYEFELDSNLDYKKLFLAPSTVATQNATLNSNSFSTITTADARNFPKNSGKLYINGRIVEYATRNNTQFLNCRVISGTSPVAIGNSTSIYLYGRTCLTSGNVNYFLSGYPNGNRAATPIVFRIVAVPSTIKISDGGALYTSSIFKFNDQTTNSILKAKQYNFGSIDEVIVENAGSNYRVNEKLKINNSFTYGSGFSAYIAEVTGVSVSSYDFVTEFAKSYIRVTTSTNHNLQTNDLVIFNNAISKQRVFSVITSTQFLIPRPSEFNSLNQTLSYTTSSKTALGGIVKINVANKGNNYKKLPEVTGVETTSGYGALVQLNSSNIGRISAINCESILGELIGDRKKLFSVKFPSTAKVKNNFQIATIKVISGGINYRPTDKIKVNGVVDNNYKFSITTSSGIITEVKVIYGGNNLNSIPSITVESEFGTGAQLEANLSRKLIFANDELKIGSFTNPVATCKVVNFDASSSVIEFEKLSGFIDDNDLIYLSDGSVYGNIFSVRTASAYATTSSYISFPYKFLDNYGFLNDSTQKIHNSDYLQDWSYSISSTKNTVEWRNDVIQNTHPSGFKLFGKNLIENQKPLFKNEQEVFNSSVIFKTTLANLVNLNLKLSDCKTQTISVNDVSLFEVGEFVYGNMSGATGVVKSISENYIELLLLKNVDFIIEDFLFEVTKEFAALGKNETDSAFIFYSGILQKPIESYFISNDNLIPNFSLSIFDQIVAHKLTNKFEIIDFIVDGNTLKLLKGRENFTAGSAQTLLISIDGVVQAPTFTVSGNVVTLDTTISSTSNIFVLYQQNLKKLTFTGTLTNYTLNYTPTSPCNLLIFANSVFQSQLVTDFTLSQNQLVLSSSVNSSDIFGWYIDESVSCYLANNVNILANKIVQTRKCNNEKLKCHIQSSVVKSPQSLYQITKDLLDGTVYTDPDNTTVYGYDTRFTYTTPEYSTSYVEVLNELTFNGSATTFNLKYLDGVPYTPVNGKNSLIVYINNQILDSTQYTLSGSNITFNQAYPSNTKCTIIDFVSKYFANNTTSKSADLDRLNVVQDGTRKTFNLSDRGVPQYVKNISDLFVIKNGVLTRPNSQSHSVSANKVTFVQAPTSTDNIRLTYFNRQLAPSKTKNVILDAFDNCFNGVKTTFPISLDGIGFTPVSVYHLFVIRNGVYQNPDTDYTISGSTITFTTAPNRYDEIFAYYSYDNLTQNFKFDNFAYFNGVTTRFSLTKDFISTTVQSAAHLQVFRNGVYQNPDTDYSVMSGPSINFNNAPAASESDYLYILNYKNSTDYVDVTSRFTQNNTTSLSYTSATPAVDTSVFLIYVNGILQEPDKWSFNSGTNILTFTGFVSLTLDKVKIFAFRNAKRILDSITATAGVNTYNLNVNGNQIISNYPVSAADLLITINGVPQRPEQAYTITNNTITFSNIQAGEVASIYQVGTSTHPVELVDYLDDTYVNIPAPYYFKLQNNYQSFSPPYGSDVMVSRNGVIQNPGIDYTVGNGYIIFNENIDLELENIFILYVHGTNKLVVNSISSNIITLNTTLNSNQYKNIIVNLNGISAFYGSDFTISGNTITLLNGLVPDTGTDIFVLQHSNLTVIDYFEDCPNGQRTKFRLRYNSQNISQTDVVSDADILVSVNGVIQYPGVQYTISANRGLINFQTPPLETDDIFTIQMYGNQLVTLSSVSGSNTIYNLSQTIPPVQQENLVIFSNNGWKFNELAEYTYTTNSRITLASANTSQYVFGIRFAGIFHLLDQINTPYNGVNTKFNLFLNQENFMPPGTTELDSIPSESSLIVIKNGKMLEAGIEYILQGDISSQIQFSTPLISTDIVSVKCVGSFNKLNTIAINVATNVIEMSLGVFPSVFTRSGSSVPVSLQNVLTRTGSIQITNTNVTAEIESYYPNAEIERPRSHENQILVIRDGDIQSPLYDYYVNNNKIIFTNTVSVGSKLVILDFRGTYSDVKADSRSYQINIGDKLYIDGESKERIVSDILSPTMLKTTTYNGSKPSGFTGTATTSNGKVTTISVSNGGKGYKNPVILRTLGTGFGAKATATINAVKGGVIESPITIQYPGYNQYGSQSVVATSYAYSYKQKPISTSNVKIGTKLTSTITSSTEIIPVANPQNFEQSDVVVQINSSTGSGATFRPFISNGRVRKIEVLTAGIGYDDRDAEVLVIGGGGSGCVLELILDAMGRVTSVVVRNSGEGYDTFRAIINRDIIEYTNIQSNQLIGCTRSSSPTTHIQNSIVYYDKFI